MNICKFYFFYLCISLFVYTNSNASNTVATQQKTQLTQQQTMLHEIIKMIDATRLATGIEILSPGLMQALEDVPRHEFVPPELEEEAYLNIPLPIGHKQTISQPFIVALMTALLEFDRKVDANGKPTARVLEIGTGSGYQAAILSKLAAEVYTVEIIRELALQAKQRFADYGYHNVRTLIGDGAKGWPEQAPYDGIIVTAASSSVPPALLKQLKPETGTLVIPIGEERGDQELFVIRTNAAGEIKEKKPILAVRFVPLTH